MKVSEGYFKEQGRSRSGLIISQHKFSTVVLFYFIFQSYHASFFDIWDVCFSYLTC